MGVGVKVPPRTPHITCAAAQGNSYRSRRNLPSEVGWTHANSRECGSMCGGFFRRTATRTFRDRHEAGRVLATDLASYRGNDDVLVLGLARGGVPVAWEIAAALGAEMDVFLVRKLGVPRWSELAMGALASGGGVVMNDNVVSSLHITDEQVREVIDSETVELARRELAYRGGRPIADPKGKIVILVDDGIATGASMTAAVRAIRACGPQSIV